MAQNGQRQARPAREVAAAEMSTWQRNAWKSLAQWAVKGRAVEAK